MSRLDRLFIAVVMLMMGIFIYGQFRETDKLVVTMIDPNSELWCELISKDEYEKRTNTLPDSYNF